MTIFLRLLNETDKASALHASVASYRAGLKDERAFSCGAEEFKQIPGAPFSYWVTARTRHAFVEFRRLHSEEQQAVIGASTKDDGRFLRLWWETDSTRDEYRPFAKGGAYSLFYADLPLSIRWRDNGIEAKTFVSDYRAKRGWSPHWKAELHNPDFYFRPGLTWSRRSQKGLSLRVLPKGCIFADKGPAAFTSGNDHADLFALLAITNSSSFRSLVEMQMAFGSYEVGVIQRTPVPQLAGEKKDRLAELARTAWSLKRDLDTTEETSHAFLLPPQLGVRAQKYDASAIEAIQAEVNRIAFELYGFDKADRVALIALTEGSRAQTAGGEEAADEDDQDDEVDEGGKAADDHATLLSWGVGVAFGRFDWRLATGEREAAPEPDPFDPLPSRSPGMLPAVSEPFHDHAGILVDDFGHPHDLARLIENVLERVGGSAPLDVRRWLQRDFFPYHLQRYSKSRRKAPIYWPLSTDSGGYTLWLYYPALTNQTLYAAANDFVGPKLEETSKAAHALRTRTDRSRDEERRLEQLQDVEAELRELQDELLRLAPTWKPNHDDGVQITAAPLWRLFRHKPWQKVLKETWAKLEAGDYDWAQLAMSYWPERVRDKCRTDKSLAIAHGLEELYEPQPSEAARV